MKINSLRLSTFDFNSLYSDKIFAKGAKKVDFIVELILNI